MFKFLVSDAEDWAGKLGLPFLLSGEVMYACIRRNYACLYQKKSVSEEIVYVSIRRNYVFLYR